MNNRDNPAPTLDSQNAQTKLDTAVATPGDAEATLSSAPAVDAAAKHDLASIGPYRLVKKLGEGGMGQVWLAEQTAPLRRQVALKLIKVGMYDDSVLQRFQSERQSLAIMEHPSIAKVFDAGATVDGQPYFVMEYVHGVPITDYCDQKRLKIRERLELFVKVCEGVQHAHQKAIMHRDLKPANILVVEVDGKATPRIIDFGLAKAATPQAGAEAVFTQMGGWVGTPGYMSPEQADPSVQDVDTRTDVYSLGGVLYVLLTGSLPLETKKKEPLEEFLRRLRQEDPPRPSTKIGMEKQTSRTTAEMCGTEPKQLISVLRGDLDWITMKALEKDRVRRYGTPSELAADIGRYLRNEPVVAGPVSVGYRLRKYVRRHRIGVAVAGGLVLLLTGFAVMQALQLRRITRERDRANRITDFMTGMFKVSDPSEARGNSITAREILDKASKDIDTGLSKDPELKAEMVQVMGSVYDSLGLYSRAEALVRQAVDIRRRILGPEHPETLKSMNYLADVFDGQGRYSEAEKSHRETLNVRRRLLGREHPDTLNTMVDLSFSIERQGRYDEAESIAREALEIQRHLLGPDHRDTLRSMTALAGILVEEGHYSAAEGLERETLEIQRRVLGPDHPETLHSMDYLAFILESEGKYVDSEKLWRETLEKGLHVLGAEHPMILGVMRNLAFSLSQQGRHSEAVKVLNDALAVASRVLGQKNPETLELMSLLGYTLAKEGRYVSGEKLLQEARDIQKRVFGSESREPAITTYNLACVAALRGQRNLALSLLREAVDHGLMPSQNLAISQDTDLKSLHGDPRFDALVAHAKERAAAAGKKQ